MTMSIKIPPVLEAQLNAEARARSIPKSKIVREMLEKRYRPTRRGKPLTFGDVAGHLIGSLNGGPKDLSTNKKYMDGFGE
jgi:hypothetical protein